MDLGVLVLQTGCALGPGKVDQQTEQGHKEGDDAEGSRSLQVLGQQCQQ